MLAYESDGDAIDTNENLQEHEIYYYVRPDDAGAFSLTMPLSLCAQHTYDVPFV